MQFLLPAVYILFFLLLILKLKFFAVGGVPKSWLAGLFLVKLIAAALVLFVYTHHYSGADFFTYFSDSRVLLHNMAGAHEAYSPAWTGNFEDVLFSSSRAMIVLNAVLHLFSFGNFYVHAVFFCFFSFAGLTALLKAFLEHFPARRNRLIISLFLIPSILFWGSAALKESVIIGIVGLLVCITGFGLNKKYTALQVVSCIILLVLLLFLKMYVLFALLPAWIVNMIVAHSSRSLLLLKYAAVFAGCALVALLLPLVNSDYNILQLIRDKQAKAVSEATGGVFLASDTHFIRVDYDLQKDVLRQQKDSVFYIRPGSMYTQWDLENMHDTTFVKSASDTAAFHLLYSIRPARSVISIKPLRPVLSSFILYTPVAFINTLIHPTFFEVSSWYHLVIALENAWVLMLILLSVLFPDREASEKKEVLLFCIVFAFILFVLIGMTTPATGAMVRYKTIALLFLATACLLTISTGKLSKLFRKKE